MEQLFRTGEDELAELEFVEFGSLSTPATHSTGRGYRNKAGDGTALGQAAALELESAPGEDDELYKRVD